MFAFKCVLSTLESNSLHSSTYLDNMVDYESYFQLQSLQSLHALINQAELKKKTNKKKREKKSAF